MSANPRLPGLPALRARLTKFVTTNERRKLSRDDWTAREIVRMSKLNWTDYMHLMEGRYELVTAPRSAVAALERYLDRIESGMMRKVGGEIVESDKPTRRTDQVHRIQVLASGRPVLRLGHQPAQVQTLGNPFKRQGLKP